VQCLTFSCLVTAIYKVGINILCCWGGLFLEQSVVISGNRRQGDSDNQKYFSNVQTAILPNGTWIMALFQAINSSCGILSSRAADCGAFRKVTHVTSSWLLRLSCAPLFDFCETIVSRSVSGVQCACSVWGVRCSRRGSQCFSTEVCLQKSYRTTRFSHVRRFGNWH
jgi:hypothetical protein